ncbi:MAG: LptA/OstA family protein [Alphaproteobacteria bacterium]
MRFLVLTMLTFAVGLSGGVKPTPAQTLGFGGGSDQPIQIEADEGIEWQRESKLYIARGNASATQGGTTVEADKLTAFYRESATGETEIYRLDADGNVRIFSDEETASADKAVYDVFNGVLVLTGEQVQLDTREDRIVAKESLEYYEQERLAVARGEALAIRDDRRVKADVLMVHFKPESSGERVSQIDNIDAVGAVVISTPTDLAQAAEGNYVPDDGLATLSGDVRITRGTNQLNGEYAEVDFNTGISRMLNGPDSQGSGRVKALFLPAAKKGQ